MTARLVLPGPPPRSLNRLLRMHWAVRRRAGAADALRVLAAVMRVEGERGSIRCALGERRAVRFTRVARRALDQDNLAGSLKATLDALVRLRVLADDDPAHVEAAYAQRRPVAGERAHVEVEVASLGARRARGT